MKTSTLFLFFFSFSSFIYSQTLLDAENIKSIVFHSTNTNSYNPIIRLNEKLILRFDDLNADAIDYYYKIEHCDINWNPSRLIDSEFIVGFSNDRIRDYNSSFNTLVPYTNYKLTIPNESTRIKISGNYILTISNEDGVDVFQRKFIVYESKVTVAVAVHKSRNISKIDTHQSVQFTINSNSFRANNPSQEIKTVILQNNNWQNAITGLKPQFIRANQLLYLYDAETSYWGGNEFLYFDTKAIRDADINTQRVILENECYYTHLYIDEERVYSPYTLAPDINGNFVIRNVYSEYPNIEADYSRIHFNLESLEDLTGKDVFISGNFNNWQLNEENKLTYNQKSGLYEGNFLLKQGFYNYQYVTKDKNGYIRNYDVSGSHYQTENDYTVLVYYKKFGARYTKVIGVGFGSSKIILN